MDQGTAAVFIDLDELLHRQVDRVRGEEQLREHVENLIRPLLDEITHLVAPQRMGTIRLYTDSEHQGSWVKHEDESQGTEVAPHLLRAASRAAVRRLNAQLEEIPDPGPGSLELQMSLDAAQAAMSGRIRTCVLAGAARDWSPLRRRLNELGVDLLVVADDARLPTYFESAADRFMLRTELARETADVETADARSEELTQAVKSVLTRAFRTGPPRLSLRVLNYRLDPAVRDELSRRGRRPLEQLLRERQEDLEIVVERFGPDLLAVKKNVELDYVDAHFHTQGTYDALLRARGFERVRIVDPASWKAGLTAVFQKLYQQSPPFRTANDLVNWLRRETQSADSSLARAIVYQLLRFGVLAQIPPEQDLSEVRWWTLTPKWREELTSPEAAEDLVQEGLVRMLDQDCKRLRAGPVQRDVLIGWLIGEHAVGQRDAIARMERTLSRARNPERATFESRVPPSAPRRRGRGGDTPPPPGGFKSPTS